MSFNQTPHDGTLHIGSIDPDVDADVKAQYNPKELTVDKKVPWSKHSYTNKGNDMASKGRGHIAYEFTGAEGRTVSVELLFDAFGSTPPVDVADEIKKLELLAAVKDPSSPDEDKRRPPLCLIVWSDTLPSFKCVITQLTTKYTMFDADGTPLRATCTVQLQEADSLSTKDAEHKDPDQKAGPNNGGAPPAAPAAPAGGNG